jgi:hypothetical protein
MQSTKNQIIEKKVKKLGSGRKGKESKANKSHFVLNINFLNRK